MNPLDHRNRLEWRVLPRFTDYVASMADGAVQLEGGAERTADGAFLFPLRAAADADSTTFAFEGTVRFVGHGGMLNLPIGSIEVEVGPDDACRLTIADPDEPEVRLHFASGSVTRQDTGLQVDLALTQDGSELFFYRYPTGLPLEGADIVRFPGSEAERSKRVIEDFVREVPLGGNLDALDVLVAEDYIQHNPHAGQGRAGVRAFFADFRAHLDDTIHSYPQLAVRLIAENDFVVRQDERENGMLIDIWRVENGQLKEHWDCWRPAPGHNRPDGF